MAPLSLVASMAGVLAVAAKITTSLTHFIHREKDAPNTTHNIVAEVSDLRICLTQLRSWIQDPKSVNSPAISVGQIVAVGTSLVINVSELEKILDSFGLEESWSTVKRFRWVRQEKRVNAILTHVRAAKSSLNLILTILAW